jgi:predicted GNAT family acetyltransferase
MDWIFEKGKIYSTNEAGEVVAKATYIVKPNGEWDIDHTYVSPDLRGQGVAGKMMEVVANYIREQKAITTATCSYANVWLKRHAEDYADIISQDLSGEPIACKLDGSHQAGSDQKN